MAKKIAPSANRSLQQANAARLRQQRAVAEQNRQLEHKAEMKDVKGDTAVTLGRQNNKTKEDKDAAKGPEEKVTLSTPKELVKAEKTEQTGDAPKQEEAKSSTASAPKEKTVEDHSREFLNAFGSTAESSDRQEISKRASRSMEKWAAQGGGELDATTVLAAETYNHAKAAISKKMPKASEEAVREAAKSDPEVAKNLKMLDAATNYLTSIPKANAQGGSAQAGQPGDSASASQGVNAAGATPGGSANGAPLAANPFDAGQGPGGPGGPQHPGGPGGPGGPNSDEFYSKTPVEQVQMMQERQQTMNEIMQIYSQMMNERRKTMAQIHAMTMTTNQEIMEIYKNIFMRQRQIADANHNKYVSLITEAQ